MSSLRPQDRKSLCRFTFADGRQCRTPRSRNHPHFCCDHARKESQACAADKLAHELAYFFSGEYLSACDLSAALGSLIAGVARGDIKPRSARTLAYLSQTLVQTIHLAQHEYINALRHRLLAQGGQQFRPPELRLPPAASATSIPNPFRINTYRNSRKC